MGLEKSGGGGGAGSGREGVGHLLLLTWVAGIGGAWTLVSGSATLSLLLNAERRASPPIDVDKFLFFLLFLQYWAGVGGLFPRFLCTSAAFFAYQSLRGGKANFEWILGSGPRTLGWIGTWALWGEWGSGGAEFELTCGLVGVFLARLCILHFGGRPKERERSPSDPWTTAGGVRVVVVEPPPGDESDLDECDLDEEEDPWQQQQRRKGRRAYGSFSGSLSSVDQEPLAGNLQGNSLCLPSDPGASKMRRTSLPAALPIQRHVTHHSTGGGMDTALLLEAHGLVTDMLLDHAALPAHTVAGLRALATLLKPPIPILHYPSNRARPAPIMLSTDPDYTSDIDEIPYTGEKISNMPKRNSCSSKKGVSANMLRRMSTSTWTTTTSATGMPTLEPQPNSRRRRSASFRAIDIRRRHSQQEFGPSGGGSQRKTVCSLHPLSPSDFAHLSSLAADSGAVTPQSAAASPTLTPMPSPLPSRDPSPSKFPLSGSPGSPGRSDPLVTSSNSLTPSTAVNVEELRSKLRDSGKLETHDFGSGPGGEGLEALALSSCGGGGVKSGGVSAQTSAETLEDDACSTTSTLGDGPGPPADYSFGGSSATTTTTASNRLSPVIFTVQEPTDDQQLSSADDENPQVLVTPDGCSFDLLSIVSEPTLCRLGEWDYPIFDLEEASNTQILSHMCYKVFLDVGLFDTFKIPIKEFINYFHALEMGYRDKPYHNRMHAADVLHGVYYLTTQPIPGFEMLASDPETPCASDVSCHRGWFNLEESSYGIMGANFPALELMSLYTAAAMHDYDHPGRTNAFLVTTHAPQAILYNDRSVLENHHAAAAWSLLLSNDDCNFLKFLDKAEFKRFRYLVIEAILATDLKRHFEILAEFNSKVNEEYSTGIDWSQEADRLLVMEMCIKLADINGPCKFHDIHVRWTHRIAEEFYEQGDEEAELGLPISPYMDRSHPQLAKLQESFINHLVAPLCKACAEAGILPGFWEDEEEEGAGAGPDDLSISSCQETDNENDSSYSDETSGETSARDKSKRKILCLQTKHLQDNHRHWMNVIKEETRKKEEGVVKTESIAISTEDPMETIEEENNTPHSLNRSFSFEKEDSKL